MYMYQGSTLVHVPTTLQSDTGTCTYYTLSHNLNPSPRPPIVFTSCLLLSSPIIHVASVSNVCEVVQRVVWETEGGGWGGVVDKGVL